MVNYAWGDQQITFGVPVFDEEHQELVGMLNSLCAAIDKQDDQQVKQLFDEFRDSMFGHFAHEEQVMRDYEYPEYEAHYQEHQNLMREMEEASKHIERVRDKDLDMFLVNHLSYILLGHILTTDARYMPFLRERGLV